MRNMKTACFLSLLVMAILGFLSPSTAQTVQTNTLDSYRATYEAAVSNIMADAQREKNNALTAYGKNLESLLAALKKKGDIDTYPMVDAERKRFQETRTVPTNGVHVSMAEVVAAYLQQITTAYLNANRRKAELLKKYVLALNDLIKGLMTKDMITEARAAANVRKEAEESLAMIEDVLQKDASVGGQPVLSQDQPTAVNGQRPIPAEAVEYKGHHYKHFTDASDWDRANMLCKDRGGHLVVISDADENAFIYEMIKKNLRVWIGGRREMTSWRWVTAERFSYINWAPNRPFSGDTNNKLAIYGEWTTKKDKAVSSKWGNFEGDHSGVTGYVCEWDY